MATPERAVGSHAAYGPCAVGATGYPDNFLPTKAAQKSAGKKPAKKPSAPVA